MTIDARGHNYIVYGSDTGVIIYKIDGHGTVHWLHTIPSHFHEDFAPSITIDVMNELYVTYNLVGGVSFLKMDTTGQIIWNSTQPYFDHIPPKLKVDTLGNIYALTCAPVHTVSKLLPAMEYRPQIVSDQDGYIYCAYYTNREHVSTETPHGYDVVINKRDCKGNILWTCRDISFNTNRDSLNPSLVVRGSHCYVVFQTERETVIPVTSVSIPESPPAHALTSTTNIVVLKLDKDGHICWVQFPDFPGEMPSIDVDDVGDIFVTYTTSTNTCDNVVIFKMDTDGQVKWIRREANRNRRHTTPIIKCDTVNNYIYVTYVSDDINSAYSDICLLKLDLDGQSVDNSAGLPWRAKQSVFNTELKNDSPCMCVDQLGYIYICYITYGGSVNGYHGTGMSDLVICKINHDGNVVGLLQSPVFNTTSHNTHPCIGYRAGHVYISYQTDGCVPGQDRVGWSDIVVMKINIITMVADWIIQNNKYNCPITNMSPSITVNTIGQCYVAYTCRHQCSTKLKSPCGDLITICQIHDNGTFGWVKR
jgi:hypothetical protein